MSSVLEDLENDENQSQNDIAIDYSIKHPLQNCWTLWYFENDRNNIWKENLKEIAYFQTVEDFWSLYNHIKVASELKHGCDYSLFKRGVMPMWEDDVNIRGGRWLINLDKKQRTQDLDKYWLDIVLCLIGEAFDNSEEVCGATVNVRGKGDKIGLWTSDATNSVAVMEIGRKLKSRLRISPAVTIGYQIHKDNMEKSGSISKNSYTV